MEINAKRGKGQLTGGKVDMRKGKYGIAEMLNIGENPEPADSRYSCWLANDVLIGKKIIHWKLRKLL